MLEKFLAFKISDIKSENELAVGREPEVVALDSLPSSQQPVSWSLYFHCLRL